MKLKSIRVIFFSATGTTKKIVRTVCAGLVDCDLHYQDITTPGNRKNPIGIISEDLLILALPVYEERIPPFVQDSLNSMIGQGQPAIAIGVYGNVGFGVILPEMQTLLKQRGFVTIAGAAFVGEHSFSHDKLPVAVGRPNAEDLLHAKKFGNEIAEYLQSYPDNGFDPKRLLNGKLPLMARILPANSSKLFADFPYYNSNLCDQCGVCYKKCPVGAIDPITMVSDDHLCTRCFACVRYCPKNARRIQLKNKLIVKLFFRKVQKVHKVPYWEFL